MIHVPLHPRDCGAANFKPLVVQRGLALDKEVETSSGLTHLSPSINLLESSKALNDIIKPVLPVDFSKPKTIIQASLGRSGSTFQFTLLCLVAKMRDPRAVCMGLNPQDLTAYAAGNFSLFKLKEISILMPEKVAELAAKQDDFLKVVKCHPSQTNLPKTDNTVIFTTDHSSNERWASRNVTFEAHHTQMFDEFKACPLCEIDKVAHILSL